MYRAKLLGSERFRRLSKEGLWIILGQAMAVLGSLVGVRIMTGLMEPAAYGDLALGMTIATLVNQTLLGPLENGVIRFYAPAQELGELSGYFKTVRQLVTKATVIIILVILIAVTGLLVAGRREWIAISLVALVFAMLSGYNTIISGIQNAARQRSIVAIHQGIESWIRFPIAAILLLWLGASGTVAMVGYIMGVVLVIGSRSIFFLKIIPNKVDLGEKESNWRDQILKYSWPFATWGVFYWAQSASDRWALKLFASSEEVGMYAVLFQLGYNPMAMATGMAMQFLTPILFQRAGDATDSIRNFNVNTLSWRLTWLSLGLTGIFFMVSFLLHTQIFSIFVSKEYASISNLLPWMLFAGGIFAAGQTISLNLMSKMETHRMMSAKIITALLGVVCNFAGAYFLGIKGVVFAGVIFSILNIVWLMVLSKKSAAD